MEPETVVRGRYELGALLGKGGMGEVYSAFDTQKHERVAIKLLRTAATTPSAEDMERFLREGEALRLLAHPNIVQVLDMFREGDRHYLVMELVEGGSLENLLAKSALELGFILSLALDLSDALARAHRLGIVHRDIKPSNVLVAADGTPRLADFGVAHVTGERRLSGSTAIVGTLDYLSPEAIRGGEPDARSDIWAFGVLLFEMIGGRRPFTGAHSAATLHAILQAPPPDLEALRPDCPVALVDLVYRMLEKERERRIPSTREVGAELERMLREPGAGALPRVSARLAASPFDDTLRGASEPPKPVTLPEPAIPFVGREKELAELGRLLRDDRVRIVTLVGPGGIGKSRLAFEAARCCSQRLGAFAATEGRALETPETFVVELAPLTKAELVLSAVAEAVGCEFRPGGEPRDQLVAFLRNKHALLVVDNFEHLLEAATLLSDIARGAPRVTILATSRERLGLSGEHVFGVSGLSFPEQRDPQALGEFSSVRLFIESARRTGAELEPTPEVLAAAAEVCRLVRGLPLGVVLAASWANVLGPREIAEEIAKSFEFLAADLKDVPSRQHSVRAVFDYSYASLAPDEQAVFTRLSLFRGGFTRAAAAGVAGASLRTLGALTNKSLVSRDAASGRFGMHELLRQYAESRLAEAPEALAAARKLHARYFSTFVAERRERLKQPEPAAAMLELEGEIDNIRESWVRSFETCDASVGAAALEALGRFYVRRSAFGEAAAAFESATASLERPAPEGGTDRAQLLARALVHEAGARHNLWQHTKALALVARAIALLDAGRNPCEAGAAFVLLATAHFRNEGLARNEEVEAGLAAARRAIELHRQAGDPWELARTLWMLGSHHERFGAEIAEGYLRESLELQRAATGGTVLFPDTLSELGGNLALQGYFAEGCQLLREALELAERRGSDHEKLWCLQHLAMVLRRQGDYPGAEHFARQTLSLARERFPFAEAVCQALLADVLGECGRADEAAFHFRAAMLDENPLTTAIARLNLARLALERGERTEAKALYAQATPAFEQHAAIWGIAVLSNHLGHLACEEGELEVAERHFRRALRTAFEARYVPFALEAVAGLARCLSLVNEKEKAVELLSFVAGQSRVERQTLARSVEPLLAELASVLPSEAFTGAARRGAELELHGTLQSLSMDR